jgi:protein-S-isoprenylcysteine O-methyltransferase Ste14
VRTLPKRADLPVFTAVGVALHVGLPLALARHDARHRPNAQASRITKRVGQLLVASGATIVVSATLEHLRHDRSSRERAPWPGAVPEFIVLGGPYAFTRNPMYVGELLMWLGWTLMLKSGTVAVGSATMAGAMTLVVRREERRLNATFGDEYRQYADRVSRWLPTSNSRCAFIRPARLKPVPDS